MSWNEIGAIIQFDSIKLISLSCFDTYVQCTRSEFKKLEKFDMCMRDLASKQREN